MWRSRQGQLSPVTLNHYLQEGITFLNWLKRQGRVLVNPLESVTKVEVRDGDTDICRAFTDHELQRIFEVAPEYRRIAYFTAAFTGLRHDELQQLQCGDVIFSGEKSRLQVRGSTTKNGKDATIPLLPQLEHALHEYIPEDAKPTDRVFRKGVPRSRTLKIDLKAAGISERDSRGHRAIFHSFRKTWATTLHRAGVNERTAMELMRHSDRKLTDVVYTDAKLLPMQKAVRGLVDSTKWTQIWTQISGNKGHNVSQMDKNKTGDNLSETVEFEKHCTNLSHSVEGRQMVEVAGVEPASLVLSYVASTCLADSLLSLPKRL